MAGPGTARAKTKKQAVESGAFEKSQDLGSDVGWERARRLRWAEPRTVSCHPLKQMGLRAPGPPVIYSRGSSNAPNEGCIRITTTPCLPDIPPEQKFQIRDPSRGRIKDHIRTLGMSGEATAWAVWEPGLPVSFLERPSTAASGSFFCFT